ncbi:16156_t:CDS:2, partial [Acaulospora colombiana]
AQLFTELGREIVDIAEDVNTYLVILNHSLSNVSQSSLDATTHKNLLKQFTNSANDTAGSITAITAFLLSAGDVKKDSRVQSLLASTHDAGSFLKGSQMKFTSLSSCRDQARQARHDLAGAFKLTAYASALGSKYEDVDEMIHKYCRSSQSTSVVQSLVKLHNVLPFSSGGPQFEPSLIKNEQDADQIASANTSDGVNHLALAMTPEGNRWLSDCSPNATAEFMIQKQGQLATLFWTSLLEQARKVQSQDNEPAFRNLEAALRRSVTRLTNPSLRVAVVGVVKAGKSTFINSIIGQAILPAATQAATAWPCRIRHERGRMTPVLTCNPEPFNKALSAIREAGISPSKLAKCTDTQGPPKENGPAAKLEEWKEIWLNLPRYVQENTKLYEGGWVLKSTASGVDEIGSLLADINDIYRLCVRFGILFNEMQASNSWPVIHVHFKSLPDEENVQFEVGLQNMK